MQSFEYFKISKFIDLIIFYLKFDKKVKKILISLGDKYNNMNILFYSNIEWNRNKILNLKNMQNKHENSWIDKLKKW